MSEQSGARKNTLNTDQQRKLHELKKQKLGMLPFLWVMLALFFAVISLFIPLVQPPLILLAWFVVLIAAFVAATGFAKNRKLDKEIAQIEAQLNSLNNSPDLSKQS